MIETLDAVKGPADEIERKFLVDYLPFPLDRFERHRIIQGYVNINSDGSEVRVRKDNSNHFLTIKNPGFLRRPELELAIGEKQFQELWRATVGKRINKTRYIIPWNDKKVELDVFEGNLDGLVTAEIEFLSEREMLGFVYPDYFGEDVTFRPEYKNQYLATHGWELKRKIPEYDLSTGLDILTEKVDSLSRYKNNVIVGVCGGSASGKTTSVAEPLRDRFSDKALLLSMDDYYKGVGFMNDQLKLDRHISFDEPEAIDIDLIATHLGDLKNGVSIDKPIYDFKTGERQGYLKVSPKPVIILEGLFTLGDRLTSLADLKVFIDVSFYTRAARRVVRDQNRGSWGISETLRYIYEELEPLHRRYIEPTKQNADIIIKNE